MQIIPIASGKGGVGKSILAANLAIALAQNGKRTVVADFDLGGSNLHIILGMRNVTYGLGTFLTHPDIDFDQIVLPTEYPNLRFIPGDAEIPGLANLSSGQKKKLIRRISSLDADYVIIDLGAGSSLNTLDFFLISRNGIMVSAPTATSTVMGGRTRRVGKSLRLPAHLAPPLGFRPVGGYRSRYSTRQSSNLHNLHRYIDISGIHFRYILNI